METKEELLKEFRKWTVEYVEAKRTVDKLLPPLASLSKGERTTRFVPTEESLAQYDEAVKRMNNALCKRREIWEKLGKHSNQRDRLIYPSQSDLERGGMTEVIKCPICGSATVLRRAKTGRNAGLKFYVCSRYPECKGRVPI